MSTKDIEDKFKDSNYGTFKKEVADVTVDLISKIQDRYYELLNSKELDDILDKGRDKTLEIAKKKYEDMKEKIGLHR